MIDQHCCIECAVSACVRANTEDDLSAICCVAAQFLAAGPCRSNAVLRLGMVYGRRGGGTIASLFAAAQRSGRLPYLRDAADNRWTLIHVDDLAELYVRLVEMPAAGVFHAVDGQPCSVRHTIERAAAVCGVSASMEDEAVVASVHEQHTVDVMKRDVALTSTCARALDWSPRYRNFEEGAAAAYDEWCAQ